MSEITLSRLDLETDQVPKRSEKRKLSAGEQGILKLDLSQSSFNYRVSENGSRVTISGIELDHRAKLIINDEAVMAVNHPEDLKGVEITLSEGSIALSHNYSNVESCIRIN